MKYGGVSHEHSDLLPLWRKHAATNMPPECAIMIRIAP